MSNSEQNYPSTIKEHDQKMISERLYEYIDLTIGTLQPGEAVL